jgi:hypothetical protein
VSAEQRLKEQLRGAVQLRRYARPASRPEDVICCGHDLGAHDDDGCTVGWTQADVDAAYKTYKTGRRHNHCPCRVRGWAK